MTAEKEDINGGKTPMHLPNGLLADPKAERWVQRRLADAETAQNRAVAAMRDWHADHEPKHKAPPG